MRFVHRYSTLQTLVAAHGGTPIIGTVFRSTNGDRRARQVVGFDPGTKRVTWRRYRSGDEPTTCTLKTWRAWIERAQAEVAVCSSTLRAQKFETSASQAGQPAAHLADQGRGRAAAQNQGGNCGREAGQHPGRGSP